jgi:hypothetical protein
VVVQDQREYIANLKHAIADARLNAYCRANDANELDAIARYLWNIALSEALYPPLQMLEVTLRNSLHAAISDRAGGNLWFDQQPPILHQMELEKVAAAKAELQKERKPLEEGRIIAELNFGFWTSLFDRRYEQALWPALLKPVFPYMPRRIRTRWELSTRLNRIRKLRNRIFHHESILNWQNPALVPQHAEILEIIAWMNPTMRETTLLIDRFLSVYTAGLAAYRAQLEGHLNRQAP